MTLVSVFVLRDEKSFQIRRKVVNRHIIKLILFLWIKNQFLEKKLKTSSIGNKFRFSHNISEQLPEFHKNKADIVRLPRGFYYEITKYHQI